MHTLPWLTLSQLPFMRFGVWLNPSNPPWLEIPPCYGPELLLYFLLSFPYTQNAPDGYGFPSGVSEVHTQELAAKISENERLHMKVFC